MRYWISFRWECVFYSEKIVLWKCNHVFHILVSFSPKSCMKSTFSSKSVCRFCPVIFYSSLEIESSIIRIIRCVKERRCWEKVSMCLSVWLAEKLKYRVNSSYTYCALLEPRKLLEIHDVSLMHSIYTTTTIWWSIILKLSLPNFALLLPQHLVIPW